MPHMSKIDDDTYVLSYKGTWDGSCKALDGPPGKMPSPIRAATVFTRSGDKWQAAFHGENLIVDPVKQLAQNAKDDLIRAVPDDVRVLILADYRRYRTYKAHP